MRLAVVCPGQGAQQIGMGVDVAERHPAARRVFDEASEVLDLDLLALCRHGPEEELVRTDLQQPAILAVGAAIAAALDESGLLPAARIRAAFGLSLGEFTALHLAGALTLADALVLVRERGLGMQEASAQVPSGLTALRCEAEDAEALCAAARAATGGVLGVANLNAPGQVVISGDVPSLEAAEALARERGIRRPTRLPVAGAFHSELMRPGAERLRRALEGVEVLAPRVPVISNVTARPTRDPDEIRENLVLQVTSPVRFVACVQAARELGIAGVVEVGPGRVLAGLVRRIDPEMATFPADTAEALEQMAPSAGAPGGPS
jgi:[acyl-carrier-protein] S-malonyltransferase